MTVSKLEKLCSLSCLKVIRLWLRNSDFVCYLGYLSYKDKRVLTNSFLNQDPLTKYKTELMA